MRHLIYCGAAIFLTYKGVNGLNLTKDGVLKNLNNSGNFDICVLDTVDSTNNLLKNMAKEGKGECTVIIADSQTGGRGRYDRKFYSPTGTGIY